MTMTEEPGGSKQTQEMDHNAESTLIVLVGTTVHACTEESKLSSAFRKESKADMMDLTFLLTLLLAAISADVR